MSSLPGTWDLDLKTPIGTMHVQYRFTATPTTIEGIAISPMETVELANITTTDTPDGEHARWHQRVTKPMRLDLEFDVVVEGDSLTGHSRARRLPRTAVTGRRAVP